MKIRHLALAAAGFLYASVSAFAQVTAIEGKVTGVDGQPVKDAVIKIERTDITAHYHVKTDKKGHYIYMGLPFGVYDISVEIDGKEMDRVNKVHTALGDPLPENFDLQKSAAANAAKQAAIKQAVETGGQVSEDVKRGMTAEQKKQLDEQMKKEEAQMKKNAALNEAFGGGKTALENKQYDVAVEDLKKAGEIDPAQAAVWSLLGQSYAGLATTKTGADFDAAIAGAMDAYSKALALRPDDPGLHNNYALSLAKAKKLPEAQAELEKAATLDPTSAGKDYFNLGALEINAGQGDAAAEAFKKGMAATPPSPESYYQYGLILVGKAQYAADGKVTPVPGTVEAFQKYLELTPDGPNAQAAKDMLTTLGTSISTTYVNPDAPKKKKK